MNNTEVRALLQNEDVRETFLVAILAVASAKIPALEALAALPNENPTIQIQAKSLVTILKNMIIEQGINLTGENPAARMGPGNPDALTRFMTLITFEGSQYTNQTTGLAYWPYTTFQQVLDAIDDGTFIAVVYTLIEAYYSIRAAGLEQPPAATLAMPGLKS